MYIIMLKKESIVIRIYHTLNFYNILKMKSFCIFLTPIIGLALIDVRGAISIQSAMLHCVSNIPASKIVGPDRAKFIAASPYRAYIAQHFFYVKFLVPLIPLTRAAWCVTLRGNTTLKGKVKFSGTPAQIKSAPHLKGIYSYGKMSGKYLQRSYPKTVGV